MAFTNNFSTSFRWWDHICGTDNLYREYKKKLRAAKTSMKGASKAQLEAAEKALQDEFEEEGIKAEAAVGAKAKVQ